MNYKKKFRDSAPNFITVRQEFMRNLFFQFLRHRTWQQIWKFLHHSSLIGMNFWGGATVNNSGEKNAILFIFSKILDKSHQVVIFDVGANVGQFATMCIENLDHKVHIYSFEPSYITYQSLNDNINKFKYGNIVTTNNIGISDENKKIPLYSSEPNSSIASVYNLKNPIRKFNSSLTEEIQVVTIDYFCLINKILFIDYLKLDIEGHEFKALLGCKRMLSEKRIYSIQFEFGECNIDARIFFRDFYSLLSESYNIYRIIPSGLVEILRYSSELEIFATINYLAILKDEHLCAENTGCTAYMHF